MTTKLIVLAAVCVSFLAGLMIGRNSGGRGISAGAEGRYTEEPVPPGHRPTTTRIRVERGGPDGPGGPGGGGGDRMRGWISEQLKLTPEQSQQMKSIWEETLRGGMRAHEDRRRELRRQRDEGIKALVRPEDLPKYDAVLRAYADGNEQLERDMRANFESAVKQTKAMLDDEQRARYEQILERTRPPGVPWGNGPGGPGGRDRDRGDRRDHGERNESDDQTTRPSATGATTRPG